MAYSAMQAANVIIRKYKESQGPNTLTPMKLQKLLFFAQSWYFKIFDKPLINDTFSRWKFGPVIPSIYYEFETFGGNPISDYARNAKGEEVSGLFDDDDFKFIDKIIEVYGQFDGWTLSDMSHQAGTAWTMGLLGTPITDEEIRHGRV